MIKPRSAKAKGIRFERQVIAWLESLGLQARRQPGSGIYQDFPHDGEVRIGDARFLLEMKKRASLPRTFEGWIGAADILVMGPNRGSIEDCRLYMRPEVFARLVMRGSGR